MSVAVICLLAFAIVSTGTAVGQQYLQNQGPVIIDNGGGGVIPAPYYAPGQSQPGIRPLVDPYSRRGGGLFGGGRPRLLPSRLSDRIWVSADYLLWDAAGVDVPALVTSSPNGTAQTAAGVLGQPNTSVL
ncbi:MAG: BBP7 family outer membrane beta-barrel protein, partial [Planctomycetota bacterium]